MAEYNLKTPLSEEDVRKLDIGDIVYVTGTVVTLRDAGHRRALELLARGEKLPVDLKDLVLYHAGPVVKKVDDRWEVVVIGPTTSTRMEVYEYEMIEKTGLRMVIGKGGMGPRTAEACKKYGAVYTIYPGGAAALQASQVKRVVGVHWLDLGIPDAMWILEVENLGPLTVVIDSKGRNLYDEIYREARKRIDTEIYPKLGIK
ncbi:MAG: FumA C-terminus/TtdB family hydratase beta subunit [Thermoprotei archaeon]|nr:FumA C-terminus/TtdB family hydratase beta subunit [Thermoprotei archaeon]